MSFQKTLRNMLLPAALLLLALLVLCPKTAFASTWNGGGRQVWELIAEGGDGYLFKGTTVTLGTGDDKLYFVGEKDWLAAPESLTVFSVGTQEPEKLSITVYNEYGTPVSTSFTEKERSCAVAALSYGATYYIRFTVTGELPKKDYPVEAEILDRTYGSIRRTLAPGESCHFYHYLYGEAWQGLRLCPVGENNVSLFVAVPGSGYTQNFEVLGSEEKYLYANNNCFFFQAKNNGDREAVLNFYMGVPGDSVFEPIPQLYWQQTLTVPIRAAGNYAFNIYGCGGQEVDAAIAYGSQKICAGSNHGDEHLTEPAENFSMGGYFPPGNYTLYISSPDVYYVAMPTDRLSGTCGKSAWWHLRRIDAEDARSDGYTVVEEKYALEIEGFGPTYDYGYDAALGHARLPWTDAIEGYTDEAEEASGDTTMTIRRIAEVRVGGGITRLGEWLLGGIVGIGIPVSLPDSLREIGSLAFYGTNIEGDLVVPDSVLRIDAGGLKGANAEAVVIGSRAKLAGDTWKGFRVPEVGGKDTTYITLSSPNPYLDAIDGVLYTKELDRLIAFPSASIEREYEILEGAKTIDAFAFCGCTLECLTLPESMETLEKDAFVGCSFREMLVKSSLRHVDASLSGDDEGIASRYEGIFFYRDAPKGQLVGTGTRAFIYIPQGNRTWTKALRRSWKANAGKREITFMLWKPGEKLPNTITAKDIVVSAKEERTSYVPLKAKAKAGVLTCVSENPQITVSSDEGSLITVPARYTGQSTIQLISEGNRAYESMTKVINLIVNPVQNLIFGSNIYLTYSEESDQTALLDFTWYGQGKGQYVSSDANVTVAPDGLVTVKKGFYGTADITVNVPADGAYMAASATIQVIVNRW